MPVAPVFLSIQYVTVAPELIIYHTTTTNVPGVTPRQITQVEDLCPRELADKDRIC